MKYIALTFDDGPNTEVTPKILDLFERYQVRGSFFVNGNHINEDTIPVMKRAIALGCDIQNHSYSHPAMPKLSEEEILKEIKDTDDLIISVTGVAPGFFRPPYIAVDDRMFELIDYPFICGRGCNDWDQEVSVETRIKEILTGPCDGEIILLHDSEYNHKTATALETIIPKLLDEGFSLVTITELFKLCKCKPQAHNKIIYSHASDKG